MPNNFQRGDLIKFYIGEEGDLTELNIRSHNLDIESITHDVTGTKHLGKTARIGGKLDARGTVEASFDLDEAPYADPPNVVPNARGIALFGVSPAKAIQIPFIIPKVHYEAAVDTEVRYSFDIQMDTISGTFDYGVDM